MRTISPIIAILLGTVVLAEADAKPSEQHRFVTTHFLEMRNTVFAIPAVPSGSYFLSPIVALQIDAVYVDGMAVTPVPVHGSDLNSGFEYYSPVLPETMIYQMPVSQVWTLKSLDKVTGHMSIEGYTVPTDARRVEIYYRVRYPQNRVSPEMLFISVLVDEFKTRTENLPQAAGPS